MQAMLAVVVCMSVVIQLLAVTQPTVVEDTCEEALGVELLQVGLTSVASPPDFDHGSEELIAELQDLPFETDLIDFERTMLHLQTEVHPDPITRNRPMLWLHIHKAGGTFMCRMAQSMGERIATPNDGNCNWVNGLDRYIDSGRSLSGISCATRAKAFEDSKFTWGHIEHELWQSDKCWSQFSYGILLREPLALMRSMMNFHPDKGKAFVKALRQELEFPTPTNGNQDHMWKFMDNFQVRTLASAMDVPAGHVNATHLQVAQQVLSRINVVGRLEDLPSTGAMLFDSIGWPATARSHVLKKRLESHHVFDFTGEERRWLEEINQHDIALYNYVGSLQTMP